MKKKSEFIWDIYWVVTILIFMVVDISFLSINVANGETSKVILGNISLMICILSVVSHIKDAAKILLDYIASKNHSATTDR